MGNCVKRNLEPSPRTIRKHHNYQPAEQVETTPPTAAIATTLDRQPEEPDQPEQYEQDQGLPWQQQEALVQHIADREGVYTFVYPHV